jgi:iron complex outermembrane receptor protein
MHKLKATLPFSLGRLSLAIALPSSASLVLAQDTLLRRVVVEAQADETALLDGSTVDAETIQFLRPVTSDTASLLRNVPGVSLNSAGGVSSLPSIRGLADDRLRIKVDGMDLIASCPNHMNSPLS